MLMGFEGGYVRVKKEIYEEGFMRYGDFGKFFLILVLLSKMEMFLDNCKVFLNSLIIRKDRLLSDCVFLNGR